MLRETWLSEHKPELYWNMLQTAEMVAKRYNIPREKQDEYGARSQQRAAAAPAAGKFNGRDRADHRHDGRRRQGHRAALHAKK